MDTSEDQFLTQLGKTLQSWLSVEDALYRLYALIMDGANHHMISITYHSIQSVESRIVLVDTCFKLAFSRDSEEWKEWKILAKRTRDLNDKRNLIVHQPAGTKYGDGPPVTEIHPSYSNSIALAKNWTDYDGPILDPNYKPSLAKLKDKYRIDICELHSYERDFHKLYYDINSFKESITKDLSEMLQSNKKA